MLHRVPEVREVWNGLNWQRDRTQDLHNASEGPHTQHSPVTHTHSLSLSLSLSITHTPPTHTEVGLKKGRERGRGGVGEEGSTPISCLNMVNTHTSLAYTVDHRIHSHNWLYIHTHGDKFHAENSWLQGLQRLSLQYILSGQLPKLEPTCIV